MRRSPLHGALAARGAIFTRQGEWVVADLFTGLEDEYLAATRAAILADRSHRGRVRISGRDRASFLHNMLTNDIRSLPPGAGTYAALLSRTGKLVADVVVYCHDDSILLETEPERAAALLSALSRHAVSEDVGMEDVSGQEAAVSIEGPRAAELLSRFLDAPAPPISRYHFTISEAGGRPIRVSSVPHGPGPSFDVAVSAAQAAGTVERIFEAGRGLGVRFAGHRTTETRRVEGGIPRFGVDMDESHLVLEAGLDAAVSFTKGCYVGQEYVARLAHRGHLNRKLVGLKLGGARVPERGEAILGEGRSVGHVTSAVFSPALDCSIALGYVRRDFFEPGSLVSVRGVEGDLPATVVNLPFLDSP